MKPEQQRIAIAEACGTMRWSYALPKKCVGASVPDYLNDLNAMHEAESQSFNTAQRENFACHLLNIVVGEEFQRGDFVSITGVGLILTHATAAQRAEAFLRAIGKWEGE